MLAKLYAADRLCDRLEADPALDPIRDKIKLRRNEETCAMRTNEAKPTEAEKVAIAEWADGMIKCQKAWEPLNNRKAPEYYAVDNAADQLTFSLIAQLYLGQFSYAEFNSARAKNTADLVIAHANIERSLALQTQEARFRAQQIANETAANMSRLVQTQALQQMQAPEAPLRRPASLSWPAAGTRFPRWSAFASCR
jgi:hypothetical protein